MSNSVDFYGGLFLLGIGAISYFNWPAKDDWIPLDLESNSTEAAYLDRGTITWEGKKVAFSTKRVAKSGGDITSEFLMPDQQNPRGMKIDWSLDCQQKSASPLRRYIFILEGQYVLLPTSSEEGGFSLVLDGSKKEHMKWLAICDSQRPGWNPFKYEFIRKKLPTEKSPQVQTLTDWIDNKRTGKGSYTWPDATLYVGDFVQGKMTGKGTKIWASYDRYVGDFVDGQLSGKGTYIWANGERFDGDFVDGFKTGKGLYTWAKGGSYLGDFVKGEMTGKGTRIWANGDRYEGEFANGSMAGQGVYTFANGINERFWNGERSGYR